MRYLLLLLLSLLLAVTAYCADTVGSGEIGKTTTFSVTFSAGSAPIAYQWSKDGAAIQGATNSTLTLSPIKASDAGTYNVRLTNPAGSAVSNNAVYSTTQATLAPTVSVTPASQSLAIGSTYANFTAAVTGTPTPTLQWLKNGQAITGETSATLNLNNIQLGDAGTYSVRATNSAGVATSNGAVLTVAPIAIANPVVKIFP